MMAVRLAALIRDMAEGLLLFPEEVRDLPNVVRYIRASRRRANPLRLWLALAPLLGRLWVLLYEVRSEKAIRTLFWKSTKERMRGLLEKARRGEISLGEAEELLGMLRAWRRRKEAEGDWAAAIATGLLILGVLGVVARLRGEKP